MQDRAERFQTQEPARVEIYGKNGAFLCRMNNLSATGAYFEVINGSEVPKVGDLICVTVSLRHLNKTHVLNGEVVWCRDRGIGVSFIKQKELIQRLTG